MYNYVTNIVPIYRVSCEAILEKYISLEFIYFAEEIFPKSDLFIFGSLPY